MEVPMHPARSWLPGVLALALLSTRCSEQPAAPRAGGPATLRIHLTDAPGDVQAAVVTIGQVYLQGAGGRVVLRSTPYTVDLVSLAATSTVLLEGVEVPEGTYEQLRFVVTGAYLEVEEEGGATRIYASTPDYPELPPDAVVGGELRMPSLAQSGLKVDLPADALTIPATGVVDLVVDFDVAQSFGHQAGQSGAWVMHPVIRATGVTVAGPATTLAFTVQPTAATAGAAIAPPVQVTVRDALGNTMVGSTASIELTLSGTGTAGAALTGTRTRTAVNGVATFDDLKIDKAGTGYTLTATADGLTSAVSAAFAIN
jgi:hypothetical protein